MKETFPHLKYATHTAKNLFALKRNPAKIGDKILRFHGLCTWKLPDKSAKEIQNLRKFMQIINLWLTPKNAEKIHI